LAALGDRVSISQAFGCYQLQLPADAWIDIEAANDAAHRAERALTDGSVADAAGWALVANAIARRGFLPGSTGRWADAQRMRLAELRLRALAVRGEAHLRQGQASQAAADAVTAIEIDPFREPAHRLLMRARLAEGDRAEALRAYERCRRLLAEELGSDPDAETQAEHLRILQG
jgi:DNA-binding SARP family transcriptional activator